MTDPRVTPSNGRVAHVSLRGKVKAERYTEGEDRRVTAVVADLLSAGGSRDRQLLRGEIFIGLEMRDGKVFGFAAKDGYCGWLDADHLGPHPDPAPTHRVAAPRTYAKSTPGLKAPGAVTPLPFGAALVVEEESAGWSRICWSTGSPGRTLYVPAPHLAPIGSREPDPVATAEKLLGTPYLWGGNSAFGIDCSGLVQAALLASRIACPGDSDMQMTLGDPATGAHQRGDLIFWKGHVAIVVDAACLIHANAHHMAVAYEEIDAAIARIEAQGDGPVIARRRLHPA